MGLIKLESLIRYSSQDPNYKAENLLDSNGSKAWICSRQDNSGYLEAEFQLDKASCIDIIEIGNCGSHTVEIQVGKSSSIQQSTSYVPCLPAVELLTIAEAKTGANRTAFYVFDKSRMNKKVAETKWDRVKVICRPYYKNVQFGLRFLSMRTMEDATMDESYQRSKDFTPFHKRVCANVSSTSCVVTQASIPGTSIIRSKDFTPFHKRVCAPTTAPVSATALAFAIKSASVFATKSAANSPSTNKTDVDIECIDLTDESEIPSETANKNPSSYSFLGLVTHPAPLPREPFSLANPNLPPIPPKPRVKKISISSEEYGIDLHWDMIPNTPDHKIYARLLSFEIFGYQEQKNVPINTLLWKKFGTAKVMPLPMGCTLTCFIQGEKYHFSIRAVDVHNRCGFFSDPISIVYNQTQTHPAPLPREPFSLANPNLPPIPPKPRLKISPEECGIALEWDMIPNTPDHKIYARLLSFEIIGYREKKNVPINSLLWKKFGTVEVKPMGCNVTNAIQGKKYHFSVRAVDVHNRCGFYSDPVSIVYKQTKVNKLTTIKETAAVSA